MTRIRISIAMISLFFCVASMVAQRTSSTGDVNEPAAEAPDGGIGASISGTGTTNFIPLWTNSTTLGNSALFQLSGKVGIGRTTPAATLDVNGGGIFRGLLQLPSVTAATSTAGADSRPLDFLSSAFDSSTAAAVSQHFRWQAEPVGNDTSSPSGSLNLLFASGTGTPAETGFLIGSNGVLTFAATQTLPAAAVTGDLGDSGQIVNINATNSISATIAQFTGSLLVPTINATGNITAQGTINAGGAENVTGNITAGSIITVGAGSFGSITETGNISSFGGVSALVGDFSAGNAGAAVSGSNDSTVQTLQLTNTDTPANDVFIEAQFNNTKVTYFTNALGDTSAIGTKSAVVPLQDGTMVKLYSVEAPEVWFEDYGSGRLSGGLAEVSLDAKFLQTVNSSIGYHVFLTAKGDCKGLFVTHETASDFVVKELGGGASSVEFDYRVVAHRKGYEKTRLPQAKLPTMASRTAKARTR
jgi:hypothetical protein